jgi:hypothetical protein
MSLCYLALQILDAVVDEFDNIPTFRANQMVVVGAAQVGELVAGVSVTEVARHRDAAIDQELHGSVYGGLTDAEVAPADAQVQLVDCHMPGGLEEHIDNHVTLARSSETVPHHVHLEQLARCLILRKSGHEPTP